MAQALFALHGSKGQIRRGKDGEYKLILEDVDSEHSWFTDRPQRLQGTLTSQQIVEGWDAYFSDSSPNSVVSFSDAKRGFGRIQFEQSPPKLSKDGSRLVSGMKMLPLVGAPSTDSGTPAGTLDQDPLTGFKLKRGQSMVLNDPSVVVDDFTLSQITFVNKSTSKMQIDYVIGEMKAGAILNSADLPAGGTVVIAGTTHDKWDLSANVMVWDKVSWKKGGVVQADNPWYGTPQIEMNMTGRYYSSSQFEKDKWYGPAAGEQWLLQAPAPVLTFQYKNDDPTNGDLNKNWTFVYSNVT